MTKQFKGVIFIGRFQPFHNGHLEVIRKASSKADTVLIIIGSASNSQNSRNPFTYSQRKEMIVGSLKDAGITNFFIAPQEDSPYNDNEWVTGINRTVATFFPSVPAYNLCLIGHSKDETSFYLKLFPRYSSVDVAGVRLFDGSLINATDIRSEFFQEKGYEFQVPSFVQRFLADFKKTPRHGRLLEEAEHIREYKKQWKAAPFPPTFVTVDAVVIQAGHVILIVRKNHPGKGLLALPGGFINESEKIEDATLRELQEETNIDIPPAVLKNKIRAHHYFAHPQRGSRGRTITFASLYDLNEELDRKSLHKDSPGVGLTRIKGGDDAASAQWYPISSITPDLLFEDHYWIIKKMLALSAT